jgi:hypothetical protein
MQDFDDAEGSALKNIKETKQREELIKAGNGGEGFS